MPELVFLSVFWWLMAGAGRVALLADGDTGWHIRIGEWILSEGKFPTRDMFSYSRPGAEWFAWEWLSDLVLALVHQSLGLAGVALVACVLIAATSAVLQARLEWHGAPVLVALIVMLVAASASTIHWLARPHMFTYFLFAAALWMLESDHRRPSRRLWWLVPLAALWTNLHGGFLVLLGAIGCYAAGAACGGDWRQARRYTLVAAAALTATLVNPYGPRLHLHIARYLSSDFIRDRVVEFQSPRFRGESMLAFEVLLLAGLLVAARLWRRGERGAAILVVAMAHASLGSVRHVLLYVIAAAPAVAGEAGRWIGASRNPWIRTLAAVGSGPAAGGARALPVVGLASIAAVAGLVWAGHPRWAIADFPKEKFPLAAVQAAEKNGLGQRIFTSDQWADYLLYRHWPRLRVFFDGRSDFYGPELGGQYLDAMTAQHRWERVFVQHGFDVALLPADWPLASVLKARPDWRLDYDDGQALVLRRVSHRSAASANLSTPRGEKGNTIR